MLLRNTLTRFLRCALFKEPQRRARGRSAGGNRTAPLAYELVDHRLGA